MVSKHESERAWEIFLHNLYNRGLKGESLKLIITDGNPGLMNTIDMIYPHIQRQRCWVHKLRNVTNYLRKKDRKECIKEARALYNAENRKGAIETYFKWAKSMENYLRESRKVYRERPGRIT